MRIVQSFWNSAEWLNWPFQRINALPQVRANLTIWNLETMRRVWSYITDKSLSQTAGGHDFNLEIIPGNGGEGISIRHFHWPIDKEDALVPVLPVFLVGVLLPAHARAHAPHELPLELGVDQLPRQGVAVPGAGANLGTGTGELGGVLGAAELVLARVLHVVGAKVRLRGPWDGRIDADLMIFTFSDFLALDLFTKRPVSWPTWGFAIRLHKIS